MLHYAASPSHFTSLLPLSNHGNCTTHPIFANSFFIPFSLIHSDFPVSYDFVCREPAYMSEMATMGDDDGFSMSPAIGRPDLELLMFAIPHHQERLSPTEQSSNFVHSIGCTPTLHGMACPVSNKRHLQDLRGRLCFIFLIYILSI